MRALIHGGFHDVPPADGHVWVLLEEHQGQAPAMIDQPRGASAVTDHDRAIMRDLVLRAFLAPPPERDDVGAAPFDTSRHRDKVYGSLVAQREAEMARYTTRVMVCETRPKKKGEIPLGPLAFQDARIVREVGMLAPEHQHWLRYAYADSKSWDDEQGAVVALWARYAPKLGKVKTKTLQRAKGLVHLAVQDGKAVVNSGRHVHKVGRVRELLGVMELNWDKHWAPRWRALGDEVLAMDRDALGALCRALKGFRFVLMDREFDLMNVELSAVHDQGPDEIIAARAGDTAIPLLRSMPSSRKS